MTRKYFILIALAIVTFLDLYADFGYISYTTFNIGDDIQSVAARRFLPEDSVPIDREFIAEFDSSTEVDTIVNGWFMHTKNNGWFRDDIRAPKVSWPPAPSINPLLISIHINKGFIPEVLENLEYLRENGPIGARDFSTLKFLEEYNIPCYFSGCLTLTLENTENIREDIIYVVDIDEECMNYIKSRTNSKVECLTHIVGHYVQFDKEAREDYVNEILEKYKKAKLVVTSRLHAAMPCLAFRTPVLLISQPTEIDRFDGLIQHVRNCSAVELLQGGFDFDNPGENPQTYLPIREKLINIVTKWVNEHS